MVSLSHLSTKSLIKAASALFVALTAGTSVLPPSYSKDRSAALPAAFEQRVLDVIMKNPEVLIRSVEQYQQDLKRAADQRTTGVAKAMSSDPAHYAKGSPIFGSESASTQLYVFADFQCPYCAQVKGVLQDFIVNNPQVSLVYKHYPIESIHPAAKNAAAAAWAAYRQGAFWQFHDILYANQSMINEALFLKAAMELNLDLERFNHDRNSPHAQAAIQADVALADSLGISGTPFFVMNGEIFSGAVNTEFLKQKL